MLVNYQVTLFCTTGQYRPVASIVSYEQKDTNIDLSKDKKKRAPIIQKGIEKICAKRYWKGTVLKKYGYTKCKIRKVETEQAEMPTFFVTKRPRSARPAKPVFRYCNTLSAFCQGKNDIKLHKNFPETLCNLSIAIRSKSDIIIIVQGEQKRTDNK